MNSERSARISSHQFLLNHSLFFSWQMLKLLAQQTFYGLHLKLFQDLVQLKETVLLFKTVCKYIRILL